MPSFLDSVNRLLEGEQEMLAQGMISPLDHICWITTLGARRPSTKKALRTVRRQGIAAIKRVWLVVQADGSWGECGGIISAIWDLVKIHFAVWLQHCHIVDVLDLKKSKVRLAAFIGPKPSVFLTPL